MKRELCAIFLCLSLVLVVEARASVLPPACGDDKIKFDVTTQKDPPAPAPPQAGKAQIVFVEDQNGEHSPFHPWDVVRFGMDGAWVGANMGNSYFTLDVAPGMHHLCVSVQGWRKSFDLVPINAEPGKIYYIAGQVTESMYYYDFRLTQLNDDQAEYRLKNWQLSKWKIKPEQH